jgi:CBS domain containing-hemolysin-like protein
MLRAVLPIVVVSGLTLLISFLCSLFEAALYAITPAKIEVMRARGVTGAERLARLRADIEAPIAAILTINTIAHTLGASVCGALVGELYGSRAVGIFAAIFTVLVLSLTEIVPKSLGVRYAPVLGTSIVWPLQVMIWLVWPIVWVSKLAMSALMRSDGPRGPSEDEVVVVAGMAAKHGRMRGEERRWVENALWLDRLTAGDLRTPRPVVQTLPADTLLAELATSPARLVHSRIPLTEDGDLDRVVGFVLRRDVFDRIVERPEPGTLRELMRPLQLVPETMPAHELLRLFLEDRAHLVAVIDEYGGFEGVVTLEDVLESMLGKEIVDEHDPVSDMQALARERARDGAKRGLAGGASRGQVGQAPAGDEPDGDTRPAAAP